MSKRQQLVDLKRNVQTNFKNYILDLISKRSPLLPEKLDVIIFGASGCAGRHTALEAASILRDLQWGIAGRSRRKLEALLKDVGEKTETELSHVPIVIANLNDRRALENMAAKCRVLVNCCGPFQLYGEAVIKACIQAGTHYVDLSAEIYYMELMQRKYNEAAERNNVYVIFACGQQSLPIDVGMNYLAQKFKGTINNVEAYTEYWTTHMNIFSPIASSSVWQSAILSFTTFKELPSIRKQLAKFPLPTLKPKICYKCILQEAEVVPGICLPFPLIDQQVVERSQLLLYEQQRKRPIQFLNYLAFSNRLKAICFLIWYFIIALLAQIEFTRDILLKYPRYCSLGQVCASGGPDEQKMQNIFFKITLNALAWSMPAEDINCALKEPPDRRLMLRITGSNPIYGVACVCLLSSAATILQEAENMPERGGVYSPGAAFANTNIIEQLSKHEHGLTFEIIQNT